MYKWIPETSLVSLENVSALFAARTLSSNHARNPPTLPSRIRPRLEKKRYASQISSAGFESLDDLQFVAVVGQGAFARVALVKKRDTHHNKYCEERYEPCPLRCGRRIRAKNLSQHIDHECVRRAY